MTDQDIKRNIDASLKSFSSGSFSKNALALFGTLGYNTSRQNPFAHKTTAEFEDNFGHAFAEKNFKKEKARFDEWRSVDLLFQLSREELSSQQGLFDSNKINWVGEDEKTVIETYLFFAIELTQPEYSRTDLAQITREVNKIFPMPVMIIFRHGQTLTLSIIDRRLHKRDAQKDVLKKVTLIKDISIASPHRAHLEILFDLSLDELKRVYKFTNFVELHQAWQKTLDTKELNKRFYRELANWYFWAIKNVSFPNDVADDKDDTVFNSESVIRMLTRLIFIWFIKEKHLIPENIFDEKELKGMVKNFNTAGSTVYYRAILQNLFFATLNKKIDERAFATDGEFKQNIKHYGIKNLYRYSSDFNISKEAVMKMFAGVPFLNGGLFDCLDFEDEKGKVLYLDGFSRKPIKQAQVPDKLFFAREHTIDLSDVYDDKKKKNEKVKGLFEIFNHYKFTITENTPIEEEIALDPELLGRVFENLLASYNPETQTTARKQTGSFYTPREIVNYMVDESLKAYLKQNLETEAKLKPHDADAGLDILFTYTEKEHAFTGKETKTLIDAIDNCKILDPACGSGAFPMGILHKLVHILHKLDPQNEKWKERQITKARQIDDPAIREKSIADIEAAFANNELDYGRKLYLIENCIYGVDIQPIATQISKLRFFISLIVDQKVDTSRDNFGIRPLPNLETKFVAANTLIGLDKPQAGGQASFENPEVKKLEDELKEMRHQYFNARTRTRKRNCQEKDKDLRKKIAELLVKDGWNKDAARSVAAFDPYDQNASSPFFDPEWMFGIKEGFDVVIGNPPYKVVSKKEQISYKNYLTINCGDLYAYFFEKSITNLLKENGIISFITASLFIKGLKFESLRTFLETKIHLIYLEVQGDKIFENVQMPTAVLIGTKVNTKANNWSFENFIPNNDLIIRISQNTKPISKISGVMRGFEIGRDQVFDNGEIKFITGSNISKWSINKFSYISKNIKNQYQKDDYYFKGDRILIRETGSELTALFLENKLYCNRSLYSLKIHDKKYTPQFVTAILNSSLMQFYYQALFKSDTELFPKIRIAQVNLLPIKYSSDQGKYKKIVDLLIYSISVSSEKAVLFFEQLLNAMVYELYFPEEIKAADAEVLKHLTDLPELKDDWSDKKKLETIEKVFQELSDAKHPVSIAMARQKTIPEIRIIEGRDQ
ncbi:MAG TPA: TaqI-like C-terminal specificity domain-containing protein [Smithellaceae bacterium]|jgi:hypothetical protein|nr:TaqI-like C-terminal specificity domain-containing protein [Smithella sp.]HQQ88205.1 TaqI-like C-terminal specificity domain-containing protein [Smithellaceae bacterium]